jgi:hypothetical protein
MVKLFPKYEHVISIAEVSHFKGLMQLWVSATTGLVASKYKDELEE